MNHPLISLIHFLAHALSLLSTNFQVWPTNSSILRISNHTSSIGETRLSLLSTSLLAHPLTCLNFSTNQPPSPSATYYPLSINLLSVTQSLSRWRSKPAFPCHISLRLQLAHYPFHNPIINSHWGGICGWGGGLRRQGTSRGDG